jgi:hypothetical protein
LKKAKNWMMELIPAGKILFILIREEWFSLYSSKKSGIILPRKESLSNDNKRGGGERRREWKVMWG